MKIHLHLGAHKTATTFMQQMLVSRHAELEALHVGFAPISRVRNNFTRLFNVYEFSGPIIQFLMRPVLRRRLVTLAEGKDVSNYFILSDENFAGMLAFNHLQRGLYRNIGRRTRYLASILKPHDVHYYFAIRSYRDFLPSAYLQLATNGREPDYQKYLARINVERYGWTEVVRRIARSVGPERLTVWTYEAFSSEPRHVFEALAPGIDPGTDIVRPRNIILPSMTLKGLKVMQALEGKFSRFELARINKLIRRMRFDPPNPRLGILDPAMIEKLDRIYAADIEAIRGMGVHLIG